MGESCNDRNLINCLIELFLEYLLSCVMMIVDVLLLLDLFILLSYGIILE